ncbi:FAD-dependent oxidoreductase [Paenibacillus antarcticus]|uniref:FAD-binding domain-containing protein n=1 Tax=Paenibacillus antarcticus TaxID=253703 RepID=A0A162PYL2_9BACL|nr:FAD-dependent oxidoreductase [Paenibacillus antarcticus]OAB40470.1 hypothetical protein PBAT_24580 [Paenibacillus antarcticus]
MKVIIIFKNWKFIHLTKHYDIDVLVVGAGPTGSTLAADLLRRGIRVRLVDKAPHAFKGSRAKGVQPRTQEVFGDHGVLGEALAEGGQYPRLGAFDKMTSTITPPRSSAAQWI